jgi:surface-anchored protein
VDGFGKPTAFLNTRDGITSADAYDVMAGSHVHMNWGFTRPGTYTVTMQATGVLANGTTTTPGPRTYTFLVLEPQAPRLSIQTVTGSQLRISFPTEMGISYRLQRRASLENGSWADLGDPLVGTGAEGHWTVPSDNTTGFFRVRLDR